MKYKLLILFLALGLVRCKSRQLLLDNYKEETKEKIESQVLVKNDIEVKIIEYDTIYITKNDTILQPVKKVIYLNRKEDIQETKTEDKIIAIQEEIKEEKKPEWRNYVLCFSLGFGLTIILVVLWKLLKR